MPAKPRNTKAVPAALRPKAKPVPKTPAVPQPAEQPGSVEQEVIHVAIIVPHPKLAEAIRDRVIVAGPANRPYRVQGHVILEQPKHRSHSLPVQVRLALAEFGLVDPEDVAMTFPEQVTLGWPKETKA